MPTFEMNKRKFTWIPSLPLEMYLLSKFSSIWRWEYLAHETCHFLCFRISSFVDGVKTIWTECEWKRNGGDWGKRKQTRWREKEKRERKKKKENFFFFLSRKWMKETCIYLFGKCLFPYMYHVHVNMHECNHRKKLTRF